MVVASFPKNLVPSGYKERKVANLLFGDTQKWVLNFFNTFRFAIGNAIPNTTSIITSQAIVDTDIYVFNSQFSDDPATIASTQPSSLLDQARCFRGDGDLERVRLGLGLLGDKYFMRFPLPIRELNDSCALIDQITPDFDRDIELFALLNEAAYLIQQGDFHRSLISSWAVCEYLINREWECYVDSTNQVLEGKQDRKTINSDRRNELVKGTKWTSSAKLEALELAKIMPFQLFDDLKIVRGARNKWLHTLEPIKLASAQAAFRVARDLMSRKLGVVLVHRGSHYMDASAFQHLPQRAEQTGT